jgi:hypothetical protein
MLVEDFLQALDVPVARLLAGSCAGISGGAVLHQYTGRCKTASFLLIPRIYWPARGWLRVGAHLHRYDPGHFFPCRRLKNTRFNNFSGLCKVVLFGTGHALVMENGSPFGL